MSFISTGDINIQQPGPKFTIDKTLLTYSLTGTFPMKTMKVEKIVTVELGKSRPSSLNNQNSQTNFFVIYCGFITTNKTSSSTI